MFSGGPEEPTASRKPVGHQRVDQLDRAVHRRKRFAKDVAKQRFLALVELADPLVGQIVAQRAAKMSRLVRPKSAANAASS